MLYEEREKSRLTGKEIQFLAKPFVDAIQKALSDSGLESTVTWSDTEASYSQWVQFTFADLRNEDVTLSISQQFHKYSSYRSYPIKDMIEFSTRSIGWDQFGGTIHRAQTWKVNEKKKTLATDKIADKIFNIHNYLKNKQNIADRQKTNKMALSEFGLRTKFKEYGCFSARESSDLDKPLLIEVTLKRSMTVEEAEKLFNGLLQLGIVEQDNDKS